MTDAEANDRFRRTFMGGAVTISAEIAKLPEETKGRILEEVRTFADFFDDTDPHDFGTFEVDGQLIAWMIEEIGTFRKGKVLSIMTGAEFVAYCRSRGVYDG